ncbi:MAG: PIG-L family deacetylase, partial [Actinomycetota bacterium]|nr:PIG-L family deacetylase [Actinomycetota bacterium]
CAVYPDARNPFAFPELLVEGLEAYSVNDIVMQASPNPNSYTDITDFVDKKLAAILEHTSQMPNPDETIEFVKAWTSQSAEAVGLPQGRFAELYQRVSTG